MANSTLPLVQFPSTVSCASDSFDYVRFAPNPLFKTHLIINCVLVFLTLIVVGLRVFSRLFLQGGFGWDDAFILFAVPQGIGMLIIQGFWINMGPGHHITQAGVNAGIILKLLVAYEFVYVTTVSTIKLSVLLFYMRVFVNHGLRLATKLSVGFVVLWTIGSILQVFLTCRPCAVTFGPTVDEKCGNQTVAFIALGTVNVVTDALILLMPTYTVWNLNMRLATRVALLGVFLIGFFTTLVASFRIVALTLIDLQGDFTETMVYSDFLSTFEPNFGILCVSLPMLGPLFMRLRTRQNSSGKNTGCSNPNKPRSGARRMCIASGKSSFLRMNDLSTASYVPPGNSPAPRPLEASDARSDGDCLDTGLSGESSTRLRTWKE